MPEHEEFLNSERSAMAVVEAAKGEKGVTSSSLAEKYGISQPAASRILNNLESKYFLREADRGKAKFYKPDYDAIADYALEQFAEYSGDKEYDSVRLKELLISIYEEIFENSGEGNSLYDLLFPCAMIQLEQKLEDKIEEIEEETRHKEQHLKEAKEEVEKVTEEERQEKLKVQKEKIQVKLEKKYNDKEMLENLKEIVEDYLYIKNS